MVLSISETRAFTSSCAGLASSYASANPGCSLSPDCTELKCSWAGGKQVELMVFNCEDPVRVVLNLQDFDQHCNRTYAVSGDGTYDDVALGGQVLHVFHSRNTSHLHFMVSNCLKYACNVHQIVRKTATDSFITQLPEPSCMTVYISRVSVAKQCCAM